MGIEMIQVSGLEGSDTVYRLVKKVNELVVAVNEIRGGLPPRTVEKSE